MNLNWSLDVLYGGYEDENFMEDMESLEDLIAELPSVLEQARELAPADGLTCVLKVLAQLNELEGNLSRYCSLRQTIDSADTQTASLLAQLGRLQSNAAASLAKIEKYIADIENLEEVTRSDAFLKEHAFFCREIQKNAAHQLGAEGETIFRKMQLSGSVTWSRLFDFLTSSLKVDYRGDVLTLSEVRNLAYSADETVRADSYAAELASYSQIQDSLAFALNSIKNEANTTAELRGFASPLARTLAQSRMTQATLDAMFTAIREGLPVFRRYMKAKAAYLGRTKGLRFYDIFAPVGSSEMTFTPEEAGEYLAEAFAAFDESAAALIREAFANEWIDFMPKKGKVGGAFCEHLAGIDQSRILTNFCGNFESVNTLAHELGHAYHGRMISGHSILNQDYPMPIAETASTFNETHLAFYALERTKSVEERLAILDSLLMGCNQVICDIYSRFLFEDEVIRRCTREFLMPDDLCSIMIAAQKASYGDGLDPEYLHPYMWACKGHYYIPGLSYYNFPYAFGCMLSMGLYAKFMEEGASFVPRYKELLAATTVNDIEAIGLLAGFDLTAPEFWRGSIDAFAKLVAEYEGLMQS